MPGLNGRGPQEQGSRSGRGMGKCKPASTRSDEEMNSKNDSRENQAFGVMRRRGRGQGRRNRFGNANQGQNQS